MRKVGLIGFPVKFSLVNILFAYWFMQYNINGKYFINRIREEEFTDFILQLKNYNLEKLEGFNVTMSYKTQILKYCDFLSKEAEEIQAVNLVRIIDGKFYGENTDIYGIEQTLKDMIIKKALIIGAGSTARTIIYVLKKLRCEIHIYNRSENKALEFKKTFDIQLADIKNPENYDIIINATPVPILHNYRKYSHTFFDVNYFYTEEYKDFIYIDGLKMFVYQAQKTFEILFNIKPMIDENLFEYLKEIRLLSQ